MFAKLCGFASVIFTGASALEAAFVYSVLPCTAGPAALTTTTFTYEQYDAIVATVQELYNKLSPTCNATYCPQADWTGCVLRMAGHEFMDFRSGVGGGSDGCVDFSDGDNAGLDVCLYRGSFGVLIADAYASYCTTVSLADFLVISAEAVIGVTRQNVLATDSIRSALDPKQSKANLSKTKQSKAKQSKAKPSKAKQSKPSKKQS